MIKFDITITASKLMAYLFFITMDLCILGLLIIGKASYIVAVVSVFVGGITTLLTAKILKESKKNV